MRLKYNSTPLDPINHEFRQWSRYTNCSIMQISRYKIKLLLLIGKVLFLLALLRLGHPITIILSLTHGWCKGGVTFTSGGSWGNCGGRLLKQRQIIMIIKLVQHNFGRQDLSRQRKRG